MHELLSKIQSPIQLHSMQTDQLEQLAVEIREVLCNLLSERSAHFASNLGVVELCLALHSVFDCGTQAKRKVSLTIDIAICL